MNRHFADGREFSLIEKLFGEDHFSKTGDGLGDDAYLWRAGGEVWAVSADSSVEGVHYRLDWAPPETALRKAVLSNLSDINAMGGRAALAFFHLCAPVSWDATVIARLGETLRGMEAEYGFRVAGGDTVRKDAGSFFAFTVMGRVSGRPLLRSGARAGHKIYVSGKLGGAAAGLTLLTGGFRLGESAERDVFIQAHLTPAPPLALGPLAEMPGAGAAIDISDGLSSELWHLSRQSGCRMAVDWVRVPRVPGLDQLTGAAAAARDWVLHGGEDYQLLFTGDFTASEMEALARVAEVSEIGVVEAGSGVFLAEENGVEKELAARGWSH